MKNPSSRAKGLSYLFIATLIGVQTFGTVHAKQSATTRAKNPVFTSDALVREWNEIAFTTIPPQPPFPANRWMAMVQVAVFEAVNAITRKYEPYQGIISAPPGASPEAAAIIAAHDVLVATFPTQAAVLNQRRDASLAQIPNGQPKTDGVGVGMAAAAAMIADRANDGSVPALFHAPTNSDPYEWQVYAGCPAAGGVFKHWSNVRPFAIESSSQFRAAPPPALNTGGYALSYLEVQAVGDINSTQRPPDRTDVARLYAAANPPALWNNVLLQIVSTGNEEITDTARAMALMNIAVNDAAISVFETKYFYRTWRPVTAITRGDEDGNRRTISGPFTPLIATPCFPSYPSAHGSLSSAAVEILESVYGNSGHSITVQHPSVPGVVLHYSELKPMLEDISDARVYGGIHFRFDQDAGEKQGSAIAKFVAKHMLKWKRL